MEVDIKLHCKILSNVAKVYYGTVMVLNLNCKFQLCFPKKTTS